jgi:hypothetical protein
MAIEEEGVGRDFVPEWARARLLDIEFCEDGDERRAKVSAVRGAGWKRDAKVVE